MSQIKYESAPPNVAALICHLAIRRVRYVIVGSVAFQCYGIDVSPGDFDITPALTLDNLTRLAQVLRDVHAALPDTDDIGRWEVQPDGEKKWISRTATPQERRARAGWIPKPEDASTFDALFYTRCGNFDIVPDLLDDYEHLMAHARQVKVHEHEVWVAHVDELLAALTIPRRSKDGSRVRQLRELQRRQRT